MHVECMTTQAAESDGELVIASIMAAAINGLAVAATMVKGTHMNTMLARDEVD